MVRTVCCVQESAAWSTAPTAPRALWWRTNEAANAQMGSTVTAVTKVCSLVHTIYKRNTLALQFLGSWPVEWIDGHTWQLHEQVYYELIWPILYCNEYIFISAITTPYVFSCGCADLILISDVGPISAKQTKLTQRQQILWHINTLVVLPVADCSV